MIKLARSSVAQTGAVLVAFRVAGLALRYLAQTSGAWRERIALFVPAAFEHIGALLGVIAVFLVTAAMWWSRRYAISMVAMVVFVVLMIAGEADLIVASITGAPLTPTVFRTFRGVQIVASSEFLEPLRVNLALTLTAGLTGAVVLLAMATVVHREQRRPAMKDFRRRDVAPVAGVACALVLIGRSLPWPVPPPPIEIAFAREYLGLDGVRLSGSESDAFKELRDAIGLPVGAGWASERYPLVYRFDDASLPRTGAQNSRPDIVVVMFESLRADALGFVTGKQPSDTPSLDALAASSVVFPTYTSNGFPSAPSVFAFHASAWPHRSKEIVGDFTKRSFDSLPRRLRDLGYETVYVAPEPHVSTEAVWLPTWYEHVVDVSVQGLAKNDHNIFHSAAAEIERHDRAGDERPLFLYIATHSTHYPFRVAGESEPSIETEADDLGTHYRSALRYADAEFGRFRLGLNGRRRRADTLLLTLGDHAFYTDLSRTSGLPENDNVWTAAIFNGPAALIGPPRRLVHPASHVDMLPTILALVGDRRPSSALGSNLFGEPRGGRRHAFAIRPGGLRLDSGIYSTFVDARMPNRADVRASFPMLFPELASTSTAAATDAAYLTSLATDWSYLIEANRVWDEAFLARQ